MGYAVGACGCGRYTTTVGDMGWVLDVGDIGWVLDVGDMQWVLVQVAGGRYATTVGDMGWVLLAVSYTHLTLPTRRTV